MTEQWAEDDMRPAFVAGAEWYEFTTTECTMWPNDVGLVEEVAEGMYPGGRYVLASVGEENDLRRAFHAGAVWWSRTVRKRTWNKHLPALGEEAGRRYPGGKLPAKEAPAAEPMAVFGEIDGRAMCYVTFVEGNKLRCAQDFRRYVGVPAGIRFAVYPVKGSTQSKLVAPGYGLLGVDYGNGAIYVQDRITLQDVETITAEAKP